MIAEGTSNGVTSQTSVTILGDDGSYGLGPQRLMVTAFGAFLRGSGGWASNDGLVRLMAELNVDSKATRGSVKRLMRRGIIDADEFAGTRGVRLTPRALEILTAADRRIFRPVELLDDGRWVLVVYSVPESRRSERHLMRSRLEWLGFGRVASGVWIAPAHVESEVVDMLNRLGLSEYSTLLKSETPAVPDIHAAVRLWWDLDSIATGYSSFMSQHKKLHRSLGQRRAGDDERAFADYVNMMTQWRRLPFFDPGLPRALLPANWVGYEAATMFHDLHNALIEPAKLRAQQVLAETSGGRRHRR